MRLPPVSRGKMRAALERLKARKDWVMLKLRKCRIGVVGLGYVGLPLAVEFGKHFETIGFDVKAAAHRAAAQRAATVRSRCRAPSCDAAQRLTLHHRPAASSRRCQVFIVTVPTPIDDYKRPDLDAAACARARASARCCARARW